MTNTYNLKGITCSNCESKVKSVLLTLPDVTSIEVSKDNNTATVTMEKHISLNTLQQELIQAGEKYKITATQHSEVAEQTKSWFATYKPILIVSFYITLISSVVSYAYQLNIHDWMKLFMAQFFLAYSFFKMLDIKFNVRIL